MSEQALVTLAGALAECRRIRMDLTNAQGKLTEIMRVLAAHPDSSLPMPRCTECGLACRGAHSLAEHMHLSHGGPVPPHWLEAERRAGIVDGTGHGTSTGTPPSGREGGGEELAPPGADPYAAPSDKFFSDF